MGNEKWLYTDNGARWKRNTKFENMLSYKADKSEFWKKAYVRYYRLIDGKFYKKGLEFVNKEIDKFYNSNGFLPFERENLIIDMVYSLHRFGAMFDEYFMFKFYEKNARGKDMFLCDKYRFIYYRQMNKTENRRLFDNKNETYELFKKYYDREVLFCQSEEDLQKFMDFAKRHNSFIVKPYDSSGGRGVRKATAIDDIAARSFFKEEIAKGKFLVEELIQQSEEMKALHPQSVNTVRVVTVLCKSGIKIFAPFLRVGRGNSVVDNGFMGGLCCAVDGETGIVCSKAISEKYENFISHPDTGVTFVGFKLPDWEQAIKLCRELSGVVKDNRVTGWDIAHTENGWVMVEGNCRGQMLMQQATDNIGKKEILIDMLNDF